MRAVPNTVQVAAANSGAKLAGILIQAIGQIIAFFVVAWIIKLAWNLSLSNIFPITDLSYWNAFWLVVLVNMMGNVFLMTLRMGIKTKVTLDS